MYDNIAAILGLEHDDRAFKALVTMEGMEGVERTEGKGGRSDYAVLDALMPVCPRPTRAGCGRRGWRPPGGGGFPRVADGPAPPPSAGRGAGRVARGVLIPTS
ncbi:hypothetical protein [Streptomyces sp. T028]|uniref:hypothetical protein n=1 Tax=Streptomyces sp. T028 TaxID=3394379 RepID=UPI003A85BAF7